MDQNSSNSSNPIPNNDNSFGLLDEELLQWLIDLPPITPPQTNDCSNSQAPFCNNNSTSTLELVPRVVYPFGGNNNNNSNFMVEKNTNLGDPPPRNVGVARSSSGKGKRPQSEKMKAVEIERQRRQEMSTLCRSLRSILPDEYIRGKRSTADHLHEAVRYIKDMEGNIGKLTKHRDELLKGKTATGSNNNNNNNNSNNISTPQYVSVQKCREGFYEIVLKSNGIIFEENQQKLPISRALGLLGREGFSVTNSISSKIGNNLMHTIHAQVENERAIDPSVLQQRLMDCYM